MKNKITKKIKFDWEKITGGFLLITLIVSIVYAAIHIAISSSDPSSFEIHKKLRSDYVLMLLQCVLGLVVMAIPSIIERKWSIRIPSYMYIVYFIFLYCAIYLGEVRSFYYTIPHWDKILHCFSGAMLGALGFTLIDILNSSERIKVQLSPFFVALFAFCFALAAGAVWEIYEYTFDGLLSLNMQKYALEDGTQLIGRAALSDTMGDIIIDTVGSLTISLIGYFLIKKDRIRKRRTLESIGA
jgi:hypothetical protein